MFFQRTAGGSKKWGRSIRSAAAIGPGGERPGAGGGPCRQEWERAAAGRRGASGGPPSPSPRAGWKNFSAGPGKALYKKPDFWYIGTIELYPAGYEF